MSHMASDVPVDVAMGAMGYVTIPQSLSLIAVRVCCNVIVIHLEKRNMWIVTCS